MRQTDRNVRRKREVESFEYFAPCWCPSGSENRVYKSASHDWEKEQSNYTIASELSRPGYESSYNNVAIILIGDAK